MSGTSTNSALEFRAWTSGRQGKEKLEDTLTRARQERGHFRDITEASLQEEIAGEGALQPSSSDDEDEEEGEDEAEDAKPGPATTREQLYKAKADMMQHIFAARQEIFMSQQLVALMESVYQPKTAAVAIEKEIGEAIPLGSIGTDVWDAKALPVNEAREAQDKLIAHKVRLESLQDSADNLLAAATRLQDNVRKETTFWNEILAVSEKNWKISRIPGVPLLGVHFGFNGCAPEFSKRNIAALVADSDGAVALERGIGTKPKAIRSKVKRHGHFVGVSELRSLPADGETTLDARIRHARDSVFDEELFHELLRESRTSTSLGVSLQGSSLLFDTGKSNDIAFELELIALDEENSPPYGTSHESDALAKAFLVLARLLLSQKHREKIDRKREIPKPLTEVVTEDRSFSILRPLMLMMKHHSSITQLNKHLEDMAKIVRSTQIQVECQTARMGVALPQNDSTTISSLLKSFSQPLSSEAMLWLVPSDEVTLEVKLRIWTSPADGVDSTFTITRPESSELHFDDVADALAAADDALAMLLGKVLKGYAGDYWKFDIREGVLSRDSKEKGLETMWFVVDGASKTVTLHGGSPQQQKSVGWKLDNPEDTGALEDVWKTLVS